MDLSCPSGWCGHGNKSTLSPVQLLADTERQSSCRPNKSILMQMCSEIQVSEEPTLIR